MPRTKAPRDHPAVDVLESHPLVPPVAGLSTDEEGDNVEASASASWKN